MRLPRNPPREQTLEELVGRTAGLQPWRRALHVVGGCGVAWLVYALSPVSAASRWLLGAAFAASLLADLLRLRYAALNRLAFRTSGPLLSPREADRTTGVPWFLLGGFLVLWPRGGAFAVPSLLVLAFADPAASVVGRIRGRRPLGKGTVEGTAAFFIVAVLVLSRFVGVTLALPVAALAALAELLPVRVDDNLTVPVATSVGLWALSGLA